MAVNVFVGLALIALIAAPAALGQTSPVPASISAAMGHFYRGDPAGAAAILERVTADSPENASAWRILALCYRTMGKLDASLAAYHKSLALEPDSPGTLFDLAGVHALEGNADSAFALLAKVHASRKYDMTQLEVDSSFASLRHDARYPPLLQTAKDFDDPFDHQVKVIRGWDDESAGQPLGGI